MQTLQNKFSFKKIFIHFFIGIILLFLDGSSKYLASQHLVFEYKDALRFSENNSFFYDQENKKPYAVKSFPIVPYVLSLEYVRNPNIGFSFLSFLDRWVSTWKKFVIVSLIQILALVWMFVLFYTKQFTYCWSLTLATSGGLGNILNRLYCGYVIDFIKFTFPTIPIGDVLLSWPIFNLADIYITLGGILLIGDLSRKKDPVLVVPNSETRSQ